MNGQADRLAAQYDAAKTVDTMDESVAVCLEQAFSQVDITAQQNLAERLRQRTILLKERQYFQEREERILEFENRLGYRFVKPSQEELAMVRKAQETLEGFQKRKLERTQLMTAALKVEREAEAEQARILKELRLQQAREQEELLKARRLQLAQEALAREEVRLAAWWNRVRGLYIWTWVAENLTEIDMVNLEVSDSLVSGTSKCISRDGRGLRAEILTTLAGTYNGDEISFHTVTRKDVFIRPDCHSLNWALVARVSEDGELITGQFRNSEDRVYQARYVRQ